MEQLLLRERIILDSANIEKYIPGKSILITGAAGSIGSELLKQLIAFDPAHLIAVDHSEKGIYDLQANYGNLSNVTLLIANITDNEEMDRIFQDFRPQVVFHAAAYKHVKLLESQPCAAVKNNTIGTKILADLAVRNGVEKFIFISTDKAVNPVSIMGMSKRISELYLLSLNERGVSTQFVITRFGNVFGSSGSVVPHLAGQIEKDEPLAVTHPEATRYFITINEAAQLVLESAATGYGGEIMVFDMGEPVLILDLAQRMWQLHNRSQTRSAAQILIIGLQPGEKIHEELHYSYEKIVRVHKDKIYILETDHTYLPKAYYEIDLLHRTLAIGNNVQVRTELERVFDIK